MKEKISITINSKLIRDVDSIVDNIFIRNRSQAIEYLIEKAFKENKIAVILADEGNQIKGLKHRYALKVNHCTVIEKAIRKLRDSGFRTIYIVAGNDTLTRIFKLIGDGSDYGVKINFISEEIQRGSASALKLLRGEIKTTFLVVQCDIVFEHINLNELWRAHQKEKSVATMLVSSISMNKNPIYGYVNLEGNKILSYVEKPKPAKYKSSIFFAGIFVAEPEIFSYPGDSLEHNFFPGLAKRGLLGGLMYSGEHLHIHTKEDLTYVKKVLKNLN